MLTAWGTCYCKKTKDKKDFFRPSVHFVHSAVSEFIGCSLVQVQILRQKQSLFVTEHLAQTVDKSDINLISKEVVAYLNCLSVFLMSWNISLGKHDRQWSRNEWVEGKATMSRGKKNDLRRVWELLSRLHFSRKSNNHSIRLFWYTL